MKKKIYITLIVTLFIGLILIVSELLTKDKDLFKVPSGFKKEIINLSDHSRSDELLFTREVDVPSTLSFFMQSNDYSEKIVKVISDSKILGKNSNEQTFNIRNYSGNESISSTFIVDKGKYSVYITNEKVDGKLAIGYKEIPKELTEYDRLKKVDSGELNNPPKGYEQVYQADLSGRNYEGEVVHILSLPKTEKIGISVYSSLKEGNASVDFVGNSTNFYGLIYSENNICDQLELTLSEGEYQFRVNCEDAEGQIYIFVKQ